jgi:hypothetical protein
MKRDETHGYLPAGTVAYIQIKFEEVAYVKYRRFQCSVASCYVC